MRLAVTGATGFLGSWVVRQALLEGHQVVALGRDEAKGQRLAELGAAFMAVDLEDVAGLMRAFEGVDAVVHSAALSSPWGTEAAFEQANVVGTQHVAQAVLDAGVKRLVFVSSASVYAQPKERLGWKETDALPPPINRYAASKQRAERLLADTFPADRLVVLRPRAIFGRGDTAIWPRLRDVAHKTAGKLPLFKGGEGLMDMLYVEDAAAACLAAVTGTPGTYNLTQGDPRPIRSVLEAVFAHRQLPIRWRRLPVLPILGIAGWVERWYQWRGYAREPALTPYSIASMTYGQTLDTSAAKTGLGWAPRWGLEAALAYTFRSPTSLLEKGLFE